MMPRRKQGHSRRESDADNKKEDGVSRIKAGSQKVKQVHNTSKINPNVQEGDVNEEPSAKRGCFDNSAYLCQNEDEEEEEENSVMHTSVKLSGADDSGVARMIIATENLEESERSLKRKDPLYVQKKSPCKTEKMMLELPKSDSLCSKVGNRLSRTDGQDCRVKVDRLLNFGPTSRSRSQNSKSNLHQSEYTKNAENIDTVSPGQNSFSENQTDVSLALFQTTNTKVTISDTLVPLLKADDKVKECFTRDQGSKMTVGSLAADVSVFSFSSTSTKQNDLASVDSGDILKYMTSVTDAGSRLRDISVCSAQMLGLSPAVMTTVHQGKQTEVIQHNYRLSTSVMASKMDNTNGKCSPDLSTELKDIVLKDCSSCPLPSSVYGMQASNIETILSGLNVAADEEQNLLKVLGIPSLKIAGLREKEISSEAGEFKSSENTPVTQMEKYSDSKLIGCKEIAIPASLSSEISLSTNQKDACSTKPRLTLKLNNPDLLSGGATDTSDESITSINNTTDHTTSSKPYRSPKITSPQILEQHISKIISENAAIVETLDPLWTRRYMRQSSISSSQNVDLEVKRSNASVKIRRFSEDISMSGYSPIYHSKLQYALLGKTDGELHTSARQVSAISPVISLSSDNVISATTSHDDAGSSSASQPGLHQSNILPFSSEKGESLEGSPVKTLLCIKQGKSQKTSSVEHVVNAEKHPQNPEGSIIKDLLLKRRSIKLRSPSPASLEEIKGQNSLNVSNMQEISLKKQKSDDLLSVVFICVNCNIVFRNKENLETHQNHYCKGSRSHVVPYKPCLDDTPAFSSFPAHTTLESSPRSSSSEGNIGQSAASSKVGDLQISSWNTHKEAVNADDKEMGQILKKQLMAPLTGAQSPPLKKRKISEPVLPMSRLEHMGFSSSSDVTSITSTQNKYEISLSPHRCRSQSVHLFGGEVQILDGIEAKKIKIDTGLRSTFSSMLNSMPIPSASPGKSLSLNASDMSDCSSASVPTVVVTIAKPVLTAGGTMTQVHTSVSDRSITPVVTLSDHLMQAGMDEFSDLSSSSKVFSPESSSQSSLIFPSLPDDSSNKHTVDVVSSTEINSSDSRITLPPISLDLSQPTSINEAVLTLVSTPSINLQASSIGKHMQNVIITHLPKSSSNPLVLDKTFLQVSSSSSIKDESILLSGHVGSTSTTLLSPKGQKEDLLISITTPLSPSQNLIIPTVTLTPSSPVSLSPSNAETTKTEVCKHESDKMKKFLAPTRPSSLPLKKKAFTLIGSTIVSPETPRPKKTCIQLYRDGHAYTYLGLKCSTRSTYCCIYRPQPMYVPQHTDPKLSMYSNWQVVPSEELFGLTPGQLMAFYDSRQFFHNSKSIAVNAQLADPLLFTHSSYWVFRMQEKEKKNAQEKVIELRSSFTETETLAIVGDSSQGAEVEPDEVPFTATALCKAETVSEELSSSSREHGSHANPPDVSQKSTHSEQECVSDTVEAENNFYEEILDDRSDCTGDSTVPHPPKRVRIFEGGFKSTEDYTYVRGRGRGKYVCEECGIRCKKPSMLKKHIRTHTDLRPYKCRHCSFAFKTKGNLTKHMKSKAHHKKCMELGIVPVPTTIDDSQIDEEALAKQVVLQEQLERKHQQFSDGEDADDDDEDDEDFDDSEGIEEDGDGESDSGGIPISQNSRATEVHSSSSGPWGSTSDEDLGQFEDSPFDKESPSKQCQKIVEQEKEAAHSLLHLSTLNEPRWHNNKSSESYKDDSAIDLPVQPPKRETSLEIQSVPTSVISQTTTSVTSTWSTVASPRNITESSLSDSSIHSDQPLIGTPPVMWLPPEPVGHRPRSYSVDLPVGSNNRDQQNRLSSHLESMPLDNAEDVSKDVFEATQREHFGRRYSISVVREARRVARSLQSPAWHSSNVSDDCYPLTRWSELDSSEEQPMDLRVPRGRLAGVTSELLPSFGIVPEQEENITEAATYSSSQFPLKKPTASVSSQSLQNYGSFRENNESLPPQDETHPCSNVVPSVTSYTYLNEIRRESCGETPVRKDVEYISEQPSPERSDYRVCSPVTPPTPEESSHSFSQDSLPSHMAITDVYHEEPHITSRAYAEFILPASGNMEEGRCVCGICNKAFTKPSQLRLHVNIHYFERPFRCDNCAVSFRTKGHLQKHKRSVSHYNKVNMNMTFGTPTTDNPRPFKCADCKIAFRIHGHLAKHLRSKMHIMKLECLGKLPFGMYAEMERSGVSLNEIDTTDCNNSLESLQVMAQRLYQRDPRRMRWHNPELPSTDSDSSKLMPPLASHLIDGIASPSDQPAVSLSGSHVVVTEVASTSTSGVNHSMVHRLSAGVKQEPTEIVDPYYTNSGFSDGEGPLSPPPQYSLPQPREALSIDHSPNKPEAELDPSLSLHRSCTCHICGRLFKSAKFLQVHLYCDHTSWSPPAEVSGQTHESSVTTIQSSNAQKQDLTCELCGRQFVNQNTLQQHLLSHAQPRPFVCEICDAGFTSSILLVAHMATHQQVGATDHRRVDGHTDLVQTV